MVENVETRGEKYLRNYPIVLSDKSRRFLRLIPAASPQIFLLCAPEMFVFLLVRP